MQNALAATNLVIFLSSRPTRLLRNRLSIADLSNINFLSNKKVLISQNYSTGLLESDISMRGVCMQRGTGVTLSLFRIYCQGSVGVFLKLLKHLDMQGL